MHYYNADSMAVHPMFCTETYNYEIKSGKNLELKEILQNPQDFPKIFKKEFNETYRYFNIDKEVEEYAKKFDYSWNMDDEKIKVYIDRYELGPYAMGSLELEFRFDKYKDLIKPEYQNKPKRNYIKDVKYQEQIDVKMPDGKTNKLEFSEHRSDYYISDEYTVYFGGKSITKEDVCKDRNRYLVKNGKKMYFFVSSLYENLGRKIDVYLLSDKSEPLTKVCEINGRIETPDMGNTDPRNIMISERINCLGTYRVYNYYNVWKRGLVANSKDFYVYKKSEESEKNPELKLKKAIEVKQVDIDGKKIDRKKLEQGTSLTIFRTDKKTYIDLITNEKEIYRFNIETDGSSVDKVQGEKPEDLFDGINYAG